MTPQNRDVGITHHNPHAKVSPTDKGLTGYNLLRTSRASCLNSEAKPARIDRASFLLPLARMLPFLARCPYPCPLPSNRKRHDWCSSSTPSHAVYCHYGHSGGAQLVSHGSRVLQHPRASMLYYLTAMEFYSIRIALSQYCSNN